MKTALLHGSALALAGTLLMLALFFAGFHESPEKLASAQNIQAGLGLAMTATALALSMRGRRASALPADNWGYGAAFGAGAMTGTVATFLSAAPFYLYAAVLNPHFTEVTFQAQLAAAAQQLPPSRLDSVEPTLRKLSSPGILTSFQTLGGLIFSILLSAIVAIFFRHPLAEATCEPPRLP